MPVSIPDTSLQPIVFLWWVLFIGGLYSWLEAGFLQQYAGSSSRLLWRCLYVAGSCAAAAVAICVSAPAPLRLLLHCALLFPYALVALRMRLGEVFPACAILFILSTLRESLGDFLGRLTASTLRSQPAGIAAQLLLSLACLGLMAVCLRAIAACTRTACWKTPLPTLLIPGAVICCALRQTIGLDAHTAMIEPVSPYRQIGGVSAVLWVLAALAAFLTLTWAYRRLLSRENSLESQTLQLHTVQAQNKEYRSFQHDIRNHMLVVSGLVGNGEARQAEAYLQSLRIAAALLSGLPSTGNATVDIVLGDKLRAAWQGGITVSCEVGIPPDCGLADADLCALFANLLDNAITACAQLPEGAGCILLTAKQKREFLLIESTNSRPEGAGPVVYGTGLRNMQRIARKYGGTLQTEAASGSFRLSVLLCIPAAKALQAGHSR